MGILWDCLLGVSSMSRVDFPFTGGPQEMVENWIPVAWKEKDAETRQRKMGWKRGYGKTKDRLRWFIILPGVSGLPLPPPPPSPRMTFSNKA